MGIPRPFWIGVRGLYGLLLAGMCGCAHWPATASFEQREWTAPTGGKGVQLLTEHFDLRVTAKDEELRAVLPTFMEDAYAAYERVMTPGHLGAIESIEEGESGREGEGETRGDGATRRGGEGAIGAEHSETGRLGDRETWRGAGTGREIPGGGVEDSEDEGTVSESVVDGGMKIVHVPASQPARERLIVYLFDKRDEWAAFTRGTFPGQADTYLRILSGGYTDQASATAVAYDLHRDHTLSLLAHEGMHQYLARHLDRAIPAWVNEGLATQFESFELDMVEGGHAHFTPARNYLRKHDLREIAGAQEKLIPLSELLAMDAGQAIRGVRFGSQTYYAQIWSFVHFLWNGPSPIPYHAGFSRLLDDLGTERMTAAIEAERAENTGEAKVSDGELLFRHYITKDLKAAEAEYRQFVEAVVR